MVSPLLLVPVELLPEGPKGTPRITKGEDDPVLNPALALRAQGVRHRSSDDGGHRRPVRFRDAGRDRLALEKDRSFTGWTLRETTYLAMFSFAKEAMFKDLLDNETQILEHPIVRALATSNPSDQSAEFQFDPIDAADIDRLAPPEVTPLVLDADSSQRAAVSAALAGKTFVMDGPPGTGKSQTIANTIGVLLHAGKTVLFVSGRSPPSMWSATDWRLPGSGPTCSNCTPTRRAEGGGDRTSRTLDNVAMPPMSMGSLARQGAKERRERLNGYASAMNEVREPLSMSLHHVLGLLANLSTVPSAPVPEMAPTNLTESGYSGIQETLSKLVRAWRPAAQGKSFLWREVTDEQSLEVRLYQAEASLEELRGTVALNSDLVDAFGLTKPSDTPKLIALLAHQHIPHPVGVLEQWLTAESTQPLRSSRENLGRQITDLKAAEATVIEAAGVPWTAFPDATSVPATPEPVRAFPSPIDLQHESAADLTATADRLQADASMRPG